jgi:hypothetical protein
LIAVTIIVTIASATTVIVLVFIAAFVVSSRFS